MSDAEPSLSELRLAQQLLASSAEGLYAIDTEGRCIAANPAGVQVLGYDRAEELVGRNMHDLVHHSRPDGTPYPEAECGISLAHREGRRVTRDDEVLFRRDGSSFPVEYRSSPIVVAGEIRGSVLTFTDITERRRAEAEAERDRSLQRVANATARVGGWSIDVSTGALTWSGELDRIFERDRDDEVSLEPILDLYVPGDRERVASAVGRCARTGEPFDLEAELQSPSGRSLFVRLIGEARRDPEGEVVEVFGALQDITALREAARRSGELEERLRTTLESITDGFFTLDGDWRFTFLNRRAEQLLGRGPGELLGERYWDQFPASLGTEAERAYRRAMQERVTVVLDDFHDASLGGWYQANIYPSGSGLAVYFRDVTPQHLARLALAERERVLAQQAALLDAARDAILVRDLDHTTTYWNASAARLYGYTTEEAVGRSVRELLHEDPSAFDEAMEELLATGGWSGELRPVTRSGSRVVVEARWTLVREEDGRPRSVLAIESDVTERRAVEQQLLTAQRLESLGTLAGGIAHDLNNVLAPILLAVQSLQLQERDPHTTNLLSLIEQSTVRGAEMVRQVLSFARGVDGRRVELDVGTVLAEVAHIARGTFPGDIVIEHEPRDDLWTVLGDATQLHQVLMNLCINARDAMPDGGTLRLLADDLEILPPAAHAFGVPAGRYVVLGVEDDGSGMERTVVDRLFEPFFTTKGPGQGTGLGLPTSHGIVTGHGGFFRVYSEPGVGSAFRVYLPALADGQGADGRSETELELPRGAGELVLVVDDEEASRTALRAILEGAGYRVLDTGDGTEALRLIEQHRGELAVLVTDMMMPQVDGPTLAAAALERLPEVVVIAISGLTASRELARAARVGVAEFLPKPFPASTLLTTIHRALRG